MSKEEKKHLPLLGIGPIYGLLVFGITAGAMVLSFCGYIPRLYIESLHILFIALGVLLISLGVYIWISAVLIAKVDACILNDELCTSGIYAHVRNPIYSSFLFICTGILLFSKNLFLMLLPLIYWIFLTILIKNTEEKWLLKRFGNEYAEYSKHINRTIPWF